MKSFRYKNHRQEEQKVTVIELDANELCEICDQHHKLLGFTLEASGGHDSGHTQICFFCLILIYYI
jgi:hypothetical protein